MSNQISVSGPILKSKALEVIEHLEIRNFKTSNKWLERSMWYNLNAISGESSSINTGTIKK